MAWLTSRPTAIVRSGSWGATSCHRQGVHSRLRRESEFNTWFREENVPATLSGDTAAEMHEDGGADLAWWQTSGREDPMDRVIESYWGNHTLHEVMEREVWHTTQHTRQLMMFLTQLTSR